jgi:ABC-type transport system involved in multi-copper enzyme maturation permease subunit
MSSSATTACGTAACPTAPTNRAISGERERGTLRLVLSGPISRATVLMGKYLAVLIALAVALLAGVLLN